MCGVYNTFECCMTTPFASCNAETKKAAQDKLAERKAILVKTNSGINNCAAAKCAVEGSPSPAPAKVEQKFDAIIDLDDPTTFKVKAFVDAVKTATGVAEVPTAVLKAFEIIVQFTVPHGAANAKKSDMEKAIATANNVLQSQVTLSLVGRGGRRLTASTTEDVDLDVKIEVPGGTDPDAAAVKAKAVKASAGAATATALGTAIGGTVSVKLQPKAKAKVETKVKAEASQNTNLKTAIASKNVGTAIGGTVTATAVNPSASPTQPPSTPAGHAASSFASSFSAAFATVLIILQAAM